MPTRAYVKRELRDAAFLARLPGDRRPGVSTRRVLPGSRLEQGFASVRTRHGLFSDPGTAFVLVASPHGRGDGAVLAEDLLESDLGLDASS